MADNNWRAKVLEEIDTSWMKDAKCRFEKKQVKFFFEDFEKSNSSTKNKMVRFCTSCEVQEACYQHAINVGETGLWGGSYFVNGKPKNPLRARYLENDRDIAASKKVS